METNFRLLVFCEGYADEHNVPALVVMSKEGYEHWLEQPSGTLNPDYDEKLKKFEANEKISSDFWKALKEAGITNTSLIPKDRTDLIEMENNYRKNYSYHVYKPKKVKSNICAYLGNSGEDFGQELQDRRRCADEDRAVREQPAQLHLP